MIKRLKEMKVGDIFYVDTSGTQAHNGIHLVRLTNDEAGEYICETKDGTRVSMDGYEKVQPA